MELTWYLAGVGSGIVLMALWHVIKHNLTARDQGEEAKKP